MLSHTTNERVPLSPGFQYRLVAALLRGETRLLHAVEFLQPEHFSAAGLSAVWQALRQLFRKTSKLPTFALLKEQVYREHKDSEERRYFYRILRKCRKIVPDAEVEYIAKYVRDFASLQALATAYRETLPLFERGDLSGVRQVLGRALLHGDGTPNGDSWYFPEVVDRVKDRRRIPRAVFRTLIAPLDSVLRNNGLRRKETGIVLAPTGTGKTRYLAHMAKAGVLQRYRGVYYTLQLPTEDIAEILDATFSGIEQNALVDHGRTIVQRVSKIGAQYGNHLILKYFPRYKCGVHTIEAHLQQLRHLGFTPDFIVVDFLNYLMPSYANETLDQRYFQLQSVVAEWIALCQKYELYGWGGFQANRGAREQEVVTVEDIAESYGAAMEATLVVSINRTAEEKRQERARLFIAKYTHGADGLVIPIHTNYRKGAFYSAPMV